MANDKNTNEQSPKEDSNNAAQELWRNTRVLGIILVYCAIGSQLSVVNKVVVTFIPLPNFILFAQSSHHAHASHRHAWDGSRSSRLRGHRQHLHPGPRLRCRRMEVIVAPLGVLRSSP